jgi:hypothetical protein
MSAFLCVALSCVGGGLRRVDPRQRNATKCLTEGLKSSKLSSGSGLVESVTSLKEERIQDGCLLGCSAV